MEGWRKRVGVEPTILAAKDRINGFEGHEGHRTPFASRARHKSITRERFERRGLYQVIAAPLARLHAFPFFRSAIFTYPSLTMARRKKKPRLKVAKEARRRARLGIGLPPTERTIPNKRDKPTKHKETLGDLLTET